MAVQMEGDDKAAKQAYRRHTGVSVTQVDNELFLVRPAERGRSVFHLDPIGAGLWRLFAEPHTLSQAQEVVRTAFPDVDPAQVDADVADVVRRMADSGLLLPVETSQR